MELARPAAHGRGRWRQKKDELLMVMVGLLGRMKKKEHDNWGGRLAS
jgi:hypothetical protein